MRNYSEIPASRRLARYIECYWLSENQEHGHHSVLPDGCVDILFTARNREPMDLTVVGLMTRRQVHEMAPAQRFFGVRFRPGMATAFMPDAALLTDKLEPLGNIIGVAGRQLFEQLANAESQTEMIGAVESYLRPLEAPDAGLRAIERLAVHEDSVDELASQSSMSTRQLRRVFVERAGVPPKYLTRILRFRKAAEQLGKLSTNPTQVNWAQFAAACGYFDQAHFIRDFQEFTGFTPGRYLQSLGSAASYTRSHESNQT